MGPNKNQKSTRNLNLVLKSTKILIKYRVGSYEQISPCQCQCVGAKHPSMCAAFVNLLYAMSAPTPGVQTMNSTEFTRIKRSVRRRSNSKKCPETCLSLDLKVWYNSSLLIYEFKHFRIEKRDSGPFYKHGTWNDHRKRKYKMEMVVDFCGNASTKSLYQSGSHSAIVDAKALAKLSTEDQLGERFMSWFLFEESLPLTTTAQPRRNQSQMRPG